MQTLVICIDRDDDIGEKAKVLSPVIGREDNINAAVKLASADPEDSDTNTIFGGIKVLDDLLSRGIDAEIVTFAGDKNIGVVSDQKIARQLEVVLEKFDAKNAIFISDGAEDETLIPIVQSRIKIDSVKRIVVMQSQNLESTYYILKNAFNDPKISQTFFVPLGLAAVIYAVFLMANYPEGAVIGILAAIGLYMLYRGFGLDDIFVTLGGNMKTSFYAGRMTFITYTAAVLICIIATVQGAVTLWAYYLNGGIWYYGLLTLVTVFINASIWLYVAAAFIAIFGKVLDIRISGKPIIHYTSPAFFVTSLGLLFWGASTYLLSISSVVDDTGVPDVGIQYFVYSVVIAVIVALVGVKISVIKEATVKVELRAKGNNKKRDKK
ncbi:MAG: DUF373 family protein [Methanosarcinaceae archaeon]|nr:DUF373 family protein [Methanosarcinaceae archaeon]